MAKKTNISVGILKYLFWNNHSKGQRLPHPKNMHGNFPVHIFWKFRTLWGDLLICRENNKNEPTKIFKSPGVDPSSRIFPQQTGSWKYTYTSPFISKLRKLSIYPSKKMPTHPQKLIILSLHLLRLCFCSNYNSISHPVVYCFQLVIFLSNGSCNQWLRVAELQLSPSAFAPQKPPTIRLQ